MAGQLHNALVEMLTVVGIDENTGLIPQVKDKTNRSQQNLYSTPFQVDLLAVISANVAIFPNSSARPDDNYPPGQQHRRAHDPTLADRGKPHGPPSRKFIFKTDSSPDLSNSTEERDEHRSDTLSPLHRGPLLSRQASYRPVDFAQRRASKNIELFKPTELPLSPDTLNSLILLCFPDGSVTAQSERPSDRVHYLCLTDVDGQRSYATCLTYHRKYYARLLKAGMWRLTEKSTDINRPVCYVPSCLVFISKHPYFFLLKDLLSRLVRRLVEGSDSWAHILKDTTLHLCSIPVPPPGTVHVEFSQGETVFTVPPSLTPGRPVIDWDLGLLIHTFSADTVVAIMVCLLTQQRLVFVSSSYPLLPLITESLLHLLLPFQWHFTYVPVMPESLLELMDAPGTFIMGCHSKHRHLIKEIEEGPYVIDLDRSRLVAPPGGGTLPSLPLEAATIFKESYKQLEHENRIRALDCCTQFTYEDNKNSELLQRTQFNSAVVMVFLELMANLFRHVLSHIKPERSFFSKEQFLLSVPDEDRPFYEQVLETEMFGQFLRSRLSRERDYWTDLVELTRPQLRNSLASGLDKPDMWFPMRKTCSVSAINAIGSQHKPHLTSTSHSVKLPHFVYGLSSKYLDSTTKELTAQLQTCKTVSTRAALLFMRAMTLGCQGHRVRALEDLHTLASCDDRLLPPEFIELLLSELSPTDLASIQTSLLYPLSPLHKARQGAPALLAHSQSVVMELNKLPHSDTNEEAFVSYVEMLDIANEYDAIIRLYKALAGDRHAVDAESFEEFYKCWKENEVEVPHLTLHLSEHLDANEAVLTLSQTIKSSFGMGRIGLTHKRVFFLQEGTKKFKNVVHLRDIKSVDLFMQRSFFSVLPALKIHTAEARAATFSLKGSSQLWQWMVVEMWSGKMVSEDHMDPSLVQLAAQNVLLIHAYVKSGEAEFAGHHSQTEGLAPSLCYFTQLWKSGAASLPPETKDVLQHRIDPSARQPTKATVEAVLYTPGNLSGDEAEIGPHLWCGLSSGLVEVYDASSWLPATNNVHAEDRVVCLCAVGEHSVWAGSFDKAIYIIDVLTRSCHQVLRRHTDLVTDLTAHSQYVFSSSMNGIIIKWEAATAKHVTTLTLPDQLAVCSMVYKDDCLWCGTRTGVYQVSADDGHLMRKLTVTQEDQGRTECLQLACFLFTPTGELWIGMGKQGEVLVYHPGTWEMKTSLFIEGRGVSKMVQIHNKIWVGSKDGRLHIFDCESYEREKTLQAHSDGVRAMCSAHQRYVITGSGSHDGRVAIWRTSSVPCPS